MRDCIWVLGFSLPKCYPVKDGLPRWTREVWMKGSTKTIPDATALKRPHLNSGILPGTQWQWKQTLCILLTCLHCVATQWPGVNIQLETPDREVMGPFWIHLPNSGHNGAESGRRVNGIDLHPCRALLFSWTILFPAFPGGTTGITNHNLQLALGNESLDGISFGRFKES